MTSISVPIFSPTPIPTPSSVDTFLNKLKGVSNLSSCDQSNFKQLFNTLYELKDMKQQKIEIAKAAAAANNDVTPSPSPSPPPLSEVVAYKTRFDTYMSKIYTGLDTYNSIFENYKYLVDLDNVYINKTKELDGYAHKAHVLGLTDNRKTYYSNESIERLNYYYRIIFYIYLLLMFSFLVKILWRMNPEMLFLHKILLFVLFIILPFISNTIYYMGVVGIKYIQSLFPTAQSPVK
jgi:hypothetical protein